MIILTLRTDKPEAEIGLFSGVDPLTYHEWLAHRQLAETIHKELRSVLKAEHLSLSDLNGIVVYQGPGSFTGLRIGISVANALADSLGISIVGSQGEDWIKKGISTLTEGKNDRIILPHYGAPANVTAPKK